MSPSTGSGHRNKVKSENKTRNAGDERIEATIFFPSSVYWMNYELLLEYVFCRRVQRSTFIVWEKGVFGILCLIRFNIVFTMTQSQLLEQL